MSSTERQRKRDAALLKEWAGTPCGAKVTVSRANGETLRTRMTLGPYSIKGTGAYMLVEGIPGNTALHRVKKGWRKA